MPNLFLIRHGENAFSYSNKLPGHLPGIQLTAPGLEQANQLRDTLASIPIHGIYSSPLDRAVETAAPLAQAKNMGIKIIPNLTDIDVGKWAGRSLKSLQNLKLWRSVQESPSQFCFPGGESFTRVINRILQALECIISQHKMDSNIAIFYHADPIKMTLAHYLGMPLDGFQRLNIQTGSISVVRCQNNCVDVLGINLVPPCSLPQM